jgi:hypothetical protein
VTEWDSSQLRDPSPPVPGERERAAVAARAHQMGRRRRIMQGAGALGMIAALAVGVAALTAGGSSSGSGTNRIETASSSGTTAPTTAVAPTTVAAPVTTAPQVTTAPPTTAAPAVTADPGADAAPAPAPAPAPQPEVAPPPPARYTVSGTVSNIPAGVTVTVSLSGDGGSFSVPVDGGGQYAISGVPAGTYTGMYSWDAHDGTATQVGRLGGITVDGDETISFALP